MWNIFRVILLTPIIILFQHHCYYQKRDLLLIPIFDSSRRMWRKYVTSIWRYSTGQSDRIIHAKTNQNSASRRKNTISGGKNLSSSMLHWIWKLQQEGMTKLPKSTKIHKGQSIRKENNSWTREFLSHQKPFKKFNIKVAIRREKRSSYEVSWAFRMLYWWYWFIKYENFHMSLNTNT